MRGVIERPDVLALLARQHWVAGLHQLDALGISRSAVDRAVRTGAVARVHRGVVRLGAVELDLAGRALALQLALGRRAFVSGTTAGVLHGLIAVGVIAQGALWANTVIAFAVERWFAKDGKLSPEESTVMAKVIFITVNVTTIKILARAATSKQNTMDLMV